MPISLAVLLAIVQGLTEFLPVSSSGHLVVLQYYLEPLFGAEKTPLAFDIFVHLATLLVTLVYLFAEIKTMLCSFYLRTSRGAKVRRLILLIMLGTAPAVVIGLGAKELVQEAFNGINWAARGFLFTTVILGIAHFRQMKLSLGAEEGEQELDWEFPTIGQALLIGLVQALAILPGVSRSGSTIAVALILGLPVKTAVRFSFFLLIPLVLGASILELNALMTLSPSNLLSYAIGFLVTMLVGWAALLTLVRTVQGAKLIYFAAYTLILGVSLHLFG